MLPYGPCSPCHPQCSNERQEQTPIVFTPSWPIFNRCRLHDTAIVQNRSLWEQFSIMTGNYVHSNYGFRWENRMVTWMVLVMTDIDSHAPTPGQWEWTEGRWGGGGGSSADWTVDWCCMDNWSVPTHSEQAWCPFRAWYTESHILLFILTKLFVFKIEYNVKCHLKATYSFFFLLWYNIEKYVCVLYCIPVSIPGGNIT